MSDAAGGWPHDALERAATTALILGVLNVVCFGPVAGVPATMLGLRTWDAGWRARTAVALGIVGSAFWTLGAVTYLYPWFVHVG